MLVSSIIKYIKQRKYIGNNYRLPWQQQPASMATTTVFNGNNYRLPWQQLPASMATTTGFYGNNYRLPWQQLPASMATTTGFHGNNYRLQWVDLYRITTTIDSDMRRSQSMWVLDRHKTWFGTSLGASLPIQSRSDSVIDVCGGSHQESQKRRFRKSDHKERKAKCWSAPTTCTPCLHGDIDAVDSQGRSLLFYAARYGQVDTARQLVEAGCGMDQVDCLGNSALHEAVDKRQLEIAELILGDGKVDVNVTDCNGDTPLMLAVTHGDTDAVKLLHKHGADINICDMTGCSPIYRALQRGWEKIADFLLDNKCDVNTNSANEMTCFFAAAHFNKSNVDHFTKRLLKMDYDFNKDSDWLETEGCPITVKDSKLRHKVLVKAGQDGSTKRRTTLCAGKRKLIKVFRRIFES
ncbi:cortactin-binding protein 2-like [Mya arenaria]|uniref:cortactin-binding protein 2-like n=1 Tax=Mya arenaria TaxID=6604 RepID=UPI0022DFEBEE|nr:cortactin-binding protein 2-like [Mya arenaria]